VKLFGKIGRRLLAWFLLIALIPVLFMGFQGYASARRAVEREVFLHMEAVARAKHIAIEQWFKERLADVRVISANPLLTQRNPRESGAVQKRERRDIEQMLQTFREQSQSYVSLCYCDTAGKPLMCTTDEATGQPDQDFAPLVARALTSRQPIMSSIFLHPRVGPAMQMANPVRNEQGQLRGAIVATLALAGTLNPIILDTTGLGRTGQAYLVDQGKVMLTPSRFMNHPSPLTHTMDSPGIRAALAGKSGTAVYEGFAGEPVIGAWTFMPDQGWGLIAEMDAAEAFAPLARLRRDAILVAILTMAGVLVVVALISRSIAKPIQELAAASLEVSRGKLDSSVAIRLHDELGELGERFNGMVQSLRESQRQLVQSERLAAIGELAASVVHEIRNPLSAVKMNLQILESKCATDPVIAEHFRLARTQTERLESMLSELLDYSKPVTLHRRAIPVADLLRDALQHFEGGLHNISVEKHLSDSLPPVNVDPGRIAQVLLNLLLNAQQAMHEGGRITISAEQSENTVRLAVADTGPGIARENLPRVFEPFFTTRKQGTGLGLPNARKIIEAHGGTIRIHNREGHGAVVEILIPV
jgi:signal transduction histidine kinase